MKLHRINDMQAHRMHQSVNRIMETVIALDKKIAVTECANNRTPHAIMVADITSTVTRARQYLDSGLYYDELAFTTCLESLHYWLTKINDALLWVRKQDAEALARDYDAYLVKYGWTKTAPVDASSFYIDDNINKPS